jgi:hypothetical protein
MYHLSLRGLAERKYPGNQQMWQLPRFAYPQCGAHAYVATQCGVLKPHGNLELPKLIADDTAIIPGAHQPVSAW